MVDKPSSADEEELQRGLDRAADDGWPAPARGVSGDTNRANQARRAIALLRAWHDADAGAASANQALVEYVNDALSAEAQIRELTRMLQGMTALADFLLANLERATGRDGKAFVQAVADQADRYFPN